MILQDILREKGNKVFSIGPDKTIGEAVNAIVEHHVGSLLVCEGDGQGNERLVGIVTERDLLLAHAGVKCPAGMLKSGPGPCAILNCTVAELMTRDAVTAAPSDSVEQVMGLMTTRRIRHLPVLDGGRVVGVVSIGDIVKAQHAWLAVENRYMKDYIRG